MLTSKLLFGGENSFIFSIVFDFHCLMMEIISKLITFKSVFLVLCVFLEGLSKNC